MNEDNRERKRDLNERKIQTDKIKKSGTRPITNLIALHVYYYVRLVRIFRMHTLFKRVHDIKNIPCVRTDCVSFLAAVFSLHSKQPQF